MWLMWQSWREYVPSRGHRPSNVEANDATTPRRAGHRRPAVRPTARFGGAGRVVVGAVLVASACANPDATVAPVRRATAPASPAISDAVHNNGNARFYLLPPLTAAPAPTGVFDPLLAPIVEVCEWVGACAQVIARFTSEGANGSDVVRVDTSAESYIVNWNTKECLSGPCSLDAAKHYRLRIVVGKIELGYADLDVVSNGSQLKNVQTGEYIGLVDGRTLPVKFRIEQGIVAHVAVSPSQGEVPVGSTASFQATVTDLHGVALTNRVVTWTSGSAQIATVDGSGSTEGIAVGCTSITATVEGIAGAASLCVVAPPPTGTWASVQAGFKHTCALTLNGKAYCWGWNARGQVGDGTLVTRASPVPVAPSITFAKLVAGYEHTCGIEAVSARLYCWGRNDFGGVGDGTTVDRPSPTLVVSATLSAGVIDVAAGGGHTCAIASVGGTYCWGFGDYGVIGNGTWGNRSSPTLVSTTATFVGLVAGVSHTCGWNSSGASYCWGFGFYGELGTAAVPPSYFYADHPLPVYTASSYTRLFAGGNYSCAKRTTGSTDCWGLNQFGSIGLAPSYDCGAPCNPAPIEVAVGLRFTTMSLGKGREWQQGWGSATHTCGVAEDGSLWCWGSNESGQLGLGLLSAPVTNPQHVPSLPGGASTLVDVANGYQHTCVLTSRHEIWCVGMNDRGQGGRGSMGGYDVQYAVVPSP